MSHFTVLVAGENVEELLAPFHEFECTGQDDQYVQNIDQTEECRSDYENQKRYIVVDLEGKEHNRYDDCCYRELTPEEEKENLGGSGSGHHSKDWGDGKGYRPKKWFLPEGWIEKEVFVKHYETLANWASDYHGKKIISKIDEPDLKEDHKYGWIRVDEKGEVIEIIDRTNPNKQWDWYQIGGRWAGQFALKPGARGSRGEQSWFAKHEGEEYPEGRVDQAYKGDIDFEAMKAEKIKEGAKRFDMFEKVFGTNFEKLQYSWKGLWEGEYKEMGYAERRELYFGQAPLKKLGELREDETLSKEEKDFVGWGFEYEEYMIGRDAYMANIEKNYFSTFAVLLDGKWYEKGSMGWFACVSDENPLWKDEFSKLLESIPDDTLMTVVDCHI